MTSIICMGSEPDYIRCVDIDVANGEITINDAIIETDRAIVRTALTYTSEDAELLATALLGAARRVGDERQMVLV